MADPAVGTDPLTIFTWVGYTIGGIVAVVVARLGWNSGRKATEKPEDMVEIRSAIVDTLAMDRLTAAVEAHSMSLIESKMEARKTEDIAERAIKSMDGMTDEIRALSREVRELAREASNKN